VAQHFNDTTPTRIVSNLIPGIGFLGAGAIMRDRGSVTGLTTAASIFMLAAVGMAAGAGVTDIAVFTTILMLVILVPLGWLEDRLSLKQRLLTFRLTTPDAKVAMERLQDVMEELNLSMDHFQAFPLGDHSILEFQASVNHAQQVRLVSVLGGFGWKCQISPTPPHE
jgi:putative Mg2+ transporter-C (MgtC) family protein